MKNDFMQESSVTVNSENESLKLRNRLLVLHQIGNDLSAAGSFDELCRQAVQFGCQLLGHSRISIWFREGNSMQVAGSFGVDEQGNIRDERSQWLSVGRHSPMGKVLSNRQPILIENDCLLRDDKGEVVGKGMHAIAALWNGTQVIGCICLDNLLDRKPFLATDFDILGMYASVIGHLAFGKRTEDELKNSLKEKEILLREIQHRVKNNLQVISSLLNLQSAYVRDPYDAELFRQSQNRIKSMAKVFDIFRDAGDLTQINIHDYISGIIQSLFQSYQVSASAIALRREGRPESFSLAQAIPCGLIINELATNTLKHGFLYGKAKDGRLKGEITIAVKRKDQHLTIAIGNNGAPFPAEVDIHHPTSLGLQLVNTLVSQLNGTISLDKTHGTRFIITFPDKVEAAVPGISGN